jgi:protein-disulfide isomerase
MTVLRTLPTSRHRLAVALGAAVVLTALLIAANQLGAQGGSVEATAVTPSPSVAAVVEEDSLLGGIPQHGAALGEPTAPVTLVEYADLQCPYCGEWGRQTFPVLVDRYVRAGKLRIVFNGLAFVGPDSERALRTAIAAGDHGHLWDVVAGLYIRQRAENSGWVTDDMIREVAATVPGLDAEQLLDDRWNDSVTDRVSRAAARAAAVGVNSTPTFAIGPTGGKLELAAVESLDPNGIVPAIDEALRR